MGEEKITFSFGENWKEYLRSVGEDQIRFALEDIQYWLGKEAVNGREVADVGSGSGIHSLAFHSLGARRVCSFDVDPLSVESTITMWQRAGRPENWSVRQESILDEEFLARAGQFDVVYCWGVLQATGDLWKGVENVFRLVRPGGMVWIALYPRGPRYAKSLAVKRKYNAASPWGKRWMVRRHIAKYMLFRLLHGQNPLTWNEMNRRGMSNYHDFVDWLGGLPYEVASEDEVVRFARNRGLILERIEPRGEQACTNYVFRRCESPATTRKDSP